MPQIENFEKQGPFSYKLIIYVPCPRSPRVQLYCASKLHSKYIHGNVTDTFELSVSYWRNPEEKQRKGVGVSSSLIIVNVSYFSLDLKCLSLEDR